MTHDCVCPGATRPQICAVAAMATIATVPAGPMRGPGGQRFVGATQLWAGPMT